MYPHCARITGSVPNTTYVYLSLIFSCGPLQHVPLGLHLGQTVVAVGESLL